MCFSFRRFPVRFLRRYRTTPPFPKPGSSDSHMTQTLLAPGGSTQRCLRAQIRQPASDQQPAFENDLEDRFPTYTGEFSISQPNTPPFCFVTVSKLIWFSVYDLFSVSIRACGLSVFVSLCIFPNQQYGNKLSSLCPELCSSPLSHPDQSRSKDQDAAENREDPCARAAGVRKGCTRSISYCEHIIRCTLRSSARMCCFKANHVAFFHFFLHCPL